MPNGRKAFCHLETCMPLRLTPSSTLTSNGASQSPRPRIHQSLLTLGALICLSLTKVYWGLQGPRFFPPALPPALCPVFTPAPWPLLPAGLSTGGGYAIASGGPCSNRAIIVTQALEELIETRQDCSSSPGPSARSSQHLSQGDAGGHV